MRIRKTHLNYSVVSSTISIFVLLMLTSCGPSGISSGVITETAAGTDSSYAAGPKNFRLNLTDAPNHDIKSVFVNIKHAELRLSGGGKEGRLIVAENLGVVDLLKLQNGVLLPMADLNLPNDVTVTQIRLVLESEGNYIIKGDESRCDLHTPSAQQTGIKFLIHQGVTIEKGHSYSMVADFDVNKSIVLQGNGGCLLKPVLKLKCASRAEIPDDGEQPGATPTPVPSPSPSPTPTATPDLGSQVGDQTGFDDGEETTVPVISEEDLLLYF
jgi:hypothetical protein